MRAQLERELVHCCWVLEAGTKSTASANQTLCVSSGCWQSSVRAPAQPVLLLGAVCLLCHSDVPPFSRIGGFPSLASIYGCFKSNGGDKERGKSGLGCVFSMCWAPLAATGSSTDRTVLRDLLLQTSRTAESQISCTLRA